jgi:predicted ATP-grasp superfamily ATP-dependent carboligase
MLAQLAVADGYQVTALDRFGDVDLRAVARCATAAGNDALAALADGAPADAVVYGGGFENRPDLVARLSRGRELLGTPAQLLDAVRDPRAVGAAARAAGARAPQIHAGASPPLAGVWLRKPRRGGGGRGVRGWDGGALGPQEILQRRVHGLSCSAVAIGDGARAALLGVTEQLHRPPGFCWTGNVTPPRLPESQRAELTGQLRAVCAQVAAGFGVRGAFGVDAVWDGYYAWVLEVNPRPPASLELFGPGSFDAHVRGARGLGLPAPGAPPATPVASCKLVLFAERDLRAPALEWWPSGLARDIPDPGATIPSGAPVCTLISSTAGAPELAAHGARLLAQLPDAVLAGG